MCAPFKFPCWPLGLSEVLVGLLAIAGVIFSIVLLIDCLKRKGSDFANPLTSKGQYDKLIWAAAIVLSFGFYFLGAIVYYFVVKRQQPESPE